MKIIDTHVHLYDVAEPLEVLKESYQRHVSDVLLLGVDLASNQRHLDLSKFIQKETTQQNFPHIYLAFGIHPFYIKTTQENQECLTWIRQHIDQAIAIGEIGLDDSYAHVKHDINQHKQQRVVFEQQLALSVEYDLPAIVHSRQAWFDCFDMLKKMHIKKAHFHWYTGPVDLLKRIMDEGWTVSFSVVIEYQKEIQQLAKQIPLEYILIETDTPVAYPLADKEGKGKRFSATPADVFRTLKALSAVKQQPIEDVLNIVNENARRLFGK